MDIEVKEFKRLIVVDVKGRIEAATIQEFESRLSNEIEKGNIRIVIDMRGVDFFSSEGLRALHKSNKAAVSAGGEIVICAPSAAVSEIMEITGYDQHIHVIDGRKEAIAFF